MLSSRFVLVVDDVRTMRMMLRSALRSFGMVDIAEAGDGREALHILSMRRFDVIISDIMMDPMDGVGFTRHLRTPKTALPRTPVLILSGHNDVSRVKAALAAGAADFLVKPVVPSELKARLEKVLRNSRPVIRTDIYHGPDRRRRPIWVRDDRRHPDAGGEAHLL